MSPSQSHACKSTEEYDIDNVRIYTVAYSVFELLFEERFSQLVDNGDIPWLADHVTGLEASGECLLQ